jgi:hypothetical protein
MQPQVRLPISLKTKLAHHDSAWHRLLMDAGVDAARFIRMRAEKVADGSDIHAQDLHALSHSWY